MFVDGEPIPDSECWFRLLTNTAHITREGRVHSSALKFCDADNGRSWMVELSGAIVSLHKDAADIAHLGNKRVEDARLSHIAAQKPIPSKLQFCGAACASTETLRIGVGAITTDVIYTPLKDNRAHSDFVIRNSRDIVLVREWLTKVLSVVSQHNLPDLVATCGSKLAVPVANIPSTAG